MNNFFENSPAIICTVSKISGVIGLIAIPISLLVALFNLFGSKEEAALLSLYVALGGLAVFLSSLFTYAFGMLVRNSEKKDTSVKTTSPNENRLPEM